MFRPPSQAAKAVLCIFLISYYTINICYEPEETEHYLHKSAFVIFCYMASIAK